MKNVLKLLFTSFIVLGLFGCSSAQKEDVVDEEVKEEIQEENNEVKEELIVDVDYSFGSILFDAISHYDYDSVANIMEDLGAEMFEAKCKAFEYSYGDYMIPESEGSNNFAGISFTQDTFNVGYSVNRNLEPYVINNEIYLGDAYAYFTFENGLEFGLTKDGKDYVTGEDVNTCGTGSTGEEIYNIRHM